MIRTLPPNRTRPPIPMALSIFQLSLCLWFLVAGATLSVADLDNRFRSEKYDLSLEGQFPSQHYSSFGIQGLVLNYLEKSAACDDGLYTILSPRGSSIHHPGPMILDNDGHLVWFKDYKTTYNANVYTYKGERYLTFWAGNDLVRGHGKGTVYMLNSNYEEVYQIKGANGLKVDLHEFHITKDETAVYTVYQVRQVDLSEVGGPVRGWIFDSVFQEVDIETNELLFEWRATDHFSYTESADNRHSDGDSPRHPWDWFHINSIDKDSEGNFIISSRYLNCLAYIHGSSGEVLWQLGGENNLFDDLSDGAATNISWQHHARFLPQKDDSNTTKTLSIFDNSSRGPEAPEHPSRGLLVDLDTAKMTASVRVQYWNPIQISSQSQGSMQVLDNGHVLLGYGYDAAWTEFGPDGEVLCDVHFGPRVGFGKGAVLSYRVFKQKWIGQPLTLPDVALSGTTASVSWNGATEVVTWVLQGSSVELEKEVETESQADSESALLSDPSDQFKGDDKLKIFRLPPGHHQGDGVIHSRNDIPDQEFDFISAVPKKGFETKILIPLDTPYRTLRILALDKYGAQIGATKAMNWDPDTMNDEIAVYNGDADDDVSSSPSALVLMFFMGFMTAAILAGCVWLARRYSSSLLGVFSSLRRDNSRDEHKWEAVHSGEELDDLDSFSDLGPEARDEDVLLKEQQHGEV